MAEGYRSPRALISPEALIAPSARIYGLAEIGAHSLIGPNVIVGHPSPDEQRSLMHELKSGLAGDSEDYDSIVDSAVSVPTRIGESVIIRSGTVVYSGAAIGNGADIAHNCLVREGSQIGRGSHVLSGTQIMANVIVGNGCRIAGTLCNRTVVGHATSMLGHAMHRYESGVPGKVDKSPRFGNGVIVGRESSIIGDVEIESFAIIGAGAVITKSAAAGTIWVGNPATQIGGRIMEDCFDLINRVRSYAE